MFAVIQKMNVEKTCSISITTCAYLYVDLVTKEDNRDVLTDTLETIVPFRDILVGGTGRDIKHDDSALGAGEVFITQPTRALLSIRIPNIKANGPHSDRKI